MKDRGFPLPPRYEATSENAKNVCGDATQEAYHEMKRLIDSKKDLMETWLGFVSDRSVLKTFGWKTPGLLLYIYLEHAVYCRRSHDTNLHCHGIHPLLDHSY